jgi:hypothetical protein
MTEPAPTATPHGSGAGAAGDRGLLPPDPAPDAPRAPRASARPDGVTRYRVPWGVARARTSPSRTRPRRG